MSEQHYSKLSFSAVQVEDEPENPNDWKPGQFFTIVNGDGNVTALGICLPSRNGKCHWGACTVALNGQPKPPSPSWMWNGSLTKPTMTPSIHETGHWHGHLTDGIFKSQ